MAENERIILPPPPVDGRPFKQSQRVVEPEKVASHLASGARWE